MAPMDRKLSRDKLKALVKGAALLRAELTGKR
jgi:hypothetical protein